MTARPDDPHIGLVVEGPGDAKAMPILLRSLDSVDERYCDCLGRVVTLNGRSNAVKPKGIEGYVATAASRSGAVGVLVVLDQDRDGDVVALGADLLQRAEGATPKPVRLVLAVPDFEQWLYASIETLGLGVTDFSANTRGLNVIKNALAPEKYVKPVWQPKLASRIDLATALDRSEDPRKLQASFRELRSRLPPSW